MTPATTPALTTQKQKHPLKPNLDTIFNPTLTLTLAQQQQDHAPSTTPSIPHMFLVLVLLVVSLPLSRPPFLSPSLPPYIYSPLFTSNSLP